MFLGIDAELQQIHQSGGKNKALSSREALAPSMSSPNSITWMFLLWRLRPLGVFPQRHYRAGGNPFIKPEQALR
jgi:hypothetical protein